MDPDQTGRDPVELWDHRRLPVATIEELEQGQASRAIERQAEVMVLDGDDRLVSRAVTAFRRRHRGRERPVRYLPLRTGRFDRIAAELGAPKPSRRLAKRMLDDPERFQESTTQRRALRVVTSARPAPVWGFSVGLGLFFRLFEILQRSEGQGLSGLRSAVGELARQVTGGEGRRFEAVGARVSVDYQAWAEQVGYLVASGLESSWLGLSLADRVEPRWEGSESAGGLVGKVAGSAALPGFLQGGAGRAFERIHVDGNEGFVVDGELYDPAEPHVLQVGPGHVCDFVDV